MSRRAVLLTEAGVKRLRKVPRLRDRDSSAKRGSHPDHAR